MSINLARGIRQERRRLGTKAAVLKGNRFDRIVNEVYAGRSPKMETVARNPSNLRAFWQIIQGGCYFWKRNYYMFLVALAPVAYRRQKWQLSLASYPFRSFSPLANPSDVIDGSRRLLATLYDVLRGVYAYDSSTCDCRA